MTWKIDPPASPGLYIASTDKAACWARYWTGKHWTGPVHVSDLTDASRVPDATWPPAEVISRGTRVYWLEPCVYDADGWVSWGAFVRECPVAPDLRVMVRMRDGWETPSTVRAGDAAWVCAAAYKVVFGPDESVFTPWTLATPPRLGWYLVPVGACRFWDGEAWSAPLPESACLDAKEAHAPPARDPLAIVGATPWRWYSGAYREQRAAAGEPLSVPAADKSRAVEAMLCRLQPEAA
jgi:hypothetical protein